MHDMKGINFAILNFLPKVILLIILSVLNVSTFGQTPKWFVKMKQIKLFETTRNEVERVFGYPKIVLSSTGKAGVNIDYKIKGGELSVMYSIGKCTETNIYDYAVSKDVVTSVEFAPHQQIEISRFGFDLREFEKIEIEDVIGLFNYTNRRSGIYFVGGPVKMHEIEFLPTENQESLSCRNVKK